MKLDIRVALFVVGVLAGGTIVEVFHLVSDTHRREILEQRIRCAGLAEKYAKEKSDEDYDVNVERVDFFPARSSCFASTAETLRLTSSSRTEQFFVVDLITKEVLFAGACDDNKQASDYCGNGKNTALVNARDKAFQRAAKRFWFW